MVFFIFGYTLRPLSLLVKSIQDGKFDADAQYPKNDIGKLAFEFNKMYLDLFDSKEDLRKEREKYRIIVENQTDLVVKIDHEGRFLFVSPSFCRLFGYIEAEIMGRSMFEYTQEKDKTELLALFRTLAEDFTTHYMTMHSRTLEGMKWLEWLTTSVRDASGRIEAFISTGRDITLRMQTEEALAESEGKFRHLADQSPNMIFINKMGRVVYVNKLSEELLGFTKEEMYDPSFNFYTLIAPESIQVVEDKFKQHLQGIEMPAYEYSIITKSGKKMDAINTTKLIRYEGGNAILGIVTDISDRKKTERALKESEEQYRLVVENANDGIVITLKERLVFANRKFQEMIGSTIDVLRASSIGDHVHPEEKEMVIGKLRGRIKGEEEPLPFSCRLTTKAGDILWVEINTVRIVWNGNPALLSFIRNITVQKNLENELIQAEKMKSIGALAGGIAHDFNNKLQLLGADCYLLLMKRKPGDEDYDELSQMKDTTEKAGELVKQLLSISKRLRSTLVPVDINTIVGKLLAVLEKSFPKSISLTLNAGTDLWAVDADASQIEQVIINLAFNSRDAMPDGGRIVISTENTYLGKDFAEAHIGVQPGKHVRLIFSDTGCGMDEMTLAHIFEPTFTTKGDKKGFGLGLAMVYNILKNHASYVFCKSAMGTGTTFEIYFPVAKIQTESEPIHDTKIDIHGGTETLLVIDDEEDILSLALKILPRHGYTVLIAKTGEDALAIYSRDPKKIDIVLIDLLMPGIDGRSCLRKIFELNPDAKVMMMSGEPIGNVIDEILGQKLSNVLYKPFDFSELLEKIRIALDSHR
jgi:PAS domain S-box-containing protein